MLFVVLGCSPARLAWSESFSVVSGLSQSPLLRSFFPRGGEVGKPKLGIDRKWYTCIRKSALFRLRTGRFTPSSQIKTHALE